MRKILIGLASLAFLFTLTLTASAAETPAPTLVVRVKSLDGLISDARFLAAQAGKAEEAKQAEAFFKSFTGEKGLEGISTKKPFGAYLMLGGDIIDSTGVILVPIEDQKALLTTLGRFGVNYKKDKAGLYLVETDSLPFPIYFRFANDYLYVTLRDNEVLSPQQLLKPADVLGNSPEVASITFDFDNVPKKLKEMVVGQAALMFGGLRENVPQNEPAIVKNLHLAMVDHADAFFKTFAEGAKNVSFKLNVDREAKNASLTLELTGKKSSKLAAMIADVEKSKSAAAGIFGSDSAVRMSVQAALPSDLRKPYEKLLELGKTELLKKAEEEPLAKKHIPGIIDALMPTLKKAEVDFAMSLVGPNTNGNYTVILGAGLEKGTGIEKAVKAVWGDLPAPIQNALTEKVKLKLDASKVGSSNVHKLDVTEELDANGRKILGEAPIYFAFRDDVVFLSVGADAMTTLTKALKSQPGSAPPFELEVSASRLAKMIGAQDANAEAVLKKVFPQSQEDTVRISLKGGNSLQFRLAMDTKLLQLIPAFVEAKQEE